MMTEILIDVTRLLDRRWSDNVPTGIDRVGLEYVRHYAHRASALVRYSGRNLLVTPNHSRVLFKEILNPTRHFKRRVSWILLYAGCQIQHEFGHKNAILFNTGHSGLESPTYLSKLMRQQLKPIFFVHDLIPLHYPEYCRAGENHHHSKRIHAALNQAHAIVTNSQVTMQHLSQYAQQYQLPFPRVIMAPIAPAKLPGPMKERPVEQNYFVMLGTIESRKNHLLILQIWQRLNRLMGNDAPKLVLIGKRGWECEQVLDLLDRCEQLRQHVIELAKCCDQEVANYLHHAQALLFPSFAEGYGMPLIEAMSLKVPVIASDLPVFREVAKDLPCYLDPIDASGWLKTIIEFNQANSTTRTEQLDKLEKFKLPTWQEHFALVDQMLIGLGNER